MNTKEKLFEIKINKNVLDKLLAKLFWVIILIITFATFVLWAFSINALQNVWGAVEGYLRSIWNLIKIPFVTSIVCTSWMIAVGLFIYYIKKN